MEKKNTFWTEMARPVVVLVVICLVASALLGFTNAKTAPVIEENIRIEAEKTRKEVRGGGKKPWRQKGTGHARQGSIRAPQWTHGGVALGPKPRDYSYTINKKVKRLALLSALSDKAANGNLIVVDKIAADEFKTKTVVAFLAAVGAGKKNLILNDTADVKFVASAANIPGVKTAVDGVNTYDVVNADKLIVSLDAAKKLEEVYA